MILPTTEARKKAALELSVSDRLAPARAFAKIHGRLTSGIVEFIEYLVSSGRLAETGGSQWWRGVNGLLILDLVDANENWLSQSFNSHTSPSVQHWIEYIRFAHQTSSMHCFQLQRLWWKAHQTSLHYGIHAFPELLLMEPRMEINFITYICVPNVDITAIINIPTNFKLIKLYTIISYPDVYPATKLLVAKSMILAPAFYARFVGATPRIANIGLDSTRWET